MNPLAGRGVAAFKPLSQGLKKIGLNSSSCNRMPKDFKLHLIQALMSSAVMGMSHRELCANFTVKLTHGKFIRKISR